MEVHHHSHTERKKLTHYLFEFLMLFLAVFAGFLAENQREHIIENRKELVFIHSAIEDLKQDVYQLDSIIAKRKEMDKWMDSLLYLMNHDPKQHGSEIYYYTRWVPRTFRFYSIDRTLTQLKYGGNWRLIHKQKVSEALANYDNLTRSLTIYIEQREESLVLILYQSINKLFDNQVFESMLHGMGFQRPGGNPSLVSYDKNLINEFCNQVHFRKN
ncbi:MAG TPA: hypothetical protein VKB95_03600, partial [Chitinophagaceae bacterium]|nr:hypothetical protein [Chitinophagaceae bacterium]